MIQNDSWRMFRILSEFVDGFETMSQVGPAISIFGSARIPNTSPYYNLAYNTAIKLGEAGFSVITGAGPSIMEAANKGAQKADVNSCGLFIDLPFEANPNQFVDPELSLRFRYFFARKVMFIRYAQGFVFFPGGYGTCDELFEVLTLIQTQKIKRLPIFLMGRAYWSGMIAWIQDQMYSEGCISENDVALFQISDDPEYVADFLKREYQNRNRVEEFAGALS